MEAAVLEHGWDGEWFRRAYDDFGRPVGSSENAEGQIFIEPQGMCVMAGMGLDDGEARRRWTRSRAPGDAARHRAAAAGLYALLPESGRNFLLPAGLKENAGSSATPTRGS